MSCFPNVMAAAHSIRDELRKTETAVTAHPYNHYRPFQSLWWLVGAKEWPAHRLGKTVLMPEANELFIGLNVEKGFGPGVAVAYPAVQTRGLVMDESWAWSRVLADMKQGALGAACRDVFSRSGELVEVRIHMQPSSDPADCRSRLLGRHHPHAPVRTRTGSREQPGVQTQNSFLSK
jgi:hypothetical protein